MNSESFLSSIVEVAIGLAGFAGIIAAIRQRGVDTWPREKRVQLQILLAASAAAIGFGLLPAFFNELGVTVEFAWRFGSGMLIAWLIGITFYRKYQCIQLEIVFQLPLLMGLWILFLIALQIYNISTTGTSWPYLFGVFGLLVNGFAIFFVLLLGSSEADSSAST